MGNDLQTEGILNFEKSMAGAWLARAMDSDAPWRILPEIGRAILSLGERLTGFLHPKEDIWIAESAVISPSATILGPCIIDEGAELRTGAFLRGAVIVGRGAVVGNSTELKNAVLFDGVQVPHFNYIGDSILGYRAHFGAGALTSNVRLDRGNVTVRRGDEKIETGLRKFGAIVGDESEIGCHAVLNPGTVLGRRSLVLPLTSVSGVVPAETICHADGRVTPRTR